jgi:hypothetical protein
MESALNLANKMEVILSPLYLRTPSLKKEVSQVAKKMSALSIDEQ